ncbi:MAG: hypothetical protein ACK5YS_03560 [bacterium]
MEGVILFADDHIFESGRLESQLFSKLNLEAGFPILPIDNLTVLERTVSSISTYRALILDWNFNKKSEEEGVVLPDENPLEIITRNKIYSLIYVYSENEIGAEIKAQLEKAYPSKIRFEKKVNDVNELGNEFKKIVDGINKFEANNQHLKTPFLWSQAINTSVQTIFNELENADPNWIKEIYSTAKTDGAEPNTEVIGVFQNLLNESIIQNSNLTKSLAASAALADVPVANKEESLAKLYNRIYYTQLLKESPIMTGDIFKFSDDEFAILITPECDVNAKKEIALEFVKFTMTASAAFIAKKKKDDTIFNNGVQSRHILPSFPFESNIYNSSAFIDFETAFIVKPKSDFENRRSEFKLNSPYIFQLRQRYLAYIGRVGVPAIPPSLRLFNLK